MKILHVPYCYFPDPVGGTEVYVHALAREQKARGFEVEIAAPAISNATYEHSGITVRRFATSSDLTLSELYAEGDPVAARSFEEYALTGKPDIIHLHSYTAAVSNRLMRRLKASGARVMFTYHTPSVTCVRGDLLSFGEYVCSGQIHGRDCSACNLQSRGMSAQVSRAMASLPPTLSQLAANTAGLVSEKVRTAFDMRRLVDCRTSSVREFLDNADHVIVVCNWIREVLLRNGIPNAKMTLCRQGLPHAAPGAKRVRRTAGNPLRLAFVGRLHKTKGIEFLASAAAKAQGDVLLDIYGTAQGPDGHAIRTRLSDLATKSNRIRVLAPVLPHRVVPTLGDYDVLAVPSQVLETGPLVVYEAFAAGIPVLGSDLGGIAELVTHGKNGMLLAHNRIDDWIRAIELLANSPALVDRFTANIERPRTMAQVAEDVLGIYSKLGQHAELPVY